MVIMPWKWKILNGVALISLTRICGTSKRTYSQRCCGRDLWLED
jgi:hypothetical protein